MNHFHVTTSLLGLGFAIAVVHLLRRDHLHVLHGLFWIGLAALAGLLGLWPGLLDHLASLAGISYSTALLLLLGC